MPAVLNFTINELIVVDQENKRLAIKKTDKLSLVDQPVTVTVTITLLCDLKAKFDLEVTYFSNGPSSEKYEGLSSKECRPSFEESQGPPVVTCS